MSPKAGARQSPADVERAARATTGGLLALARSVARQARPGEDVEAYAVEGTDTDVRVFDGVVESLTVAGRSGIGVRVVVGGRLGYAWAGSLDAQVVAETLAEARDNARYGAADEWQGMATADDSTGVVPAVLDLWRDDLLGVPVDDKVELALRLDAVTRARDARIRGAETSTYSDTIAEAVIANSLGVEASTRRTSCSCSTVAIADDGGAPQTGYGFSVGRGFNELDVEEAAGTAVDRAVRMLGATQPQTRRIPVVLDPLVTRSLLAIIGSACSGEAVTKGRSMFVGREGEPVATPGVTLVDDPTVPEARGATAHDSEGVPTRANVLIENGVLQGFLHNVTTARRSRRRTTGSAVRGGYASRPGVGARALYLVPGQRSPDVILAALPEALYVQSVSGLHSGTNPVSGDFSVGAEGLMVRGGAFAEPVREVTIASTLPRMLLDVVEVGADLTWLPGAAAGLTLVVGAMTLSGA